ncbi:hypothetical protein Sjap_008677 [Stephania japonica]|uniref:Uncharacterized protein n=1 Tax=Stephania japonica TaxID=461633 RepID=A0AAP0PB37_9MAGN
MTQDRFRMHRMAHTKKTEEPKKTKEGNKKTVVKGERVGRRVQTAFYRKSKELGRAMGDSPKVSELHDNAPIIQAPDVVAR